MFKWMPAKQSNPMRWEDENDKKNLYFIDFYIRNKHECKSERARERVKERKRARKRKKNENELINEIYN